MRSLLSWLLFRATSFRLDDSEEEGGEEEEEEDGGGEGGHLGSLVMVQREKVAAKWEMI